VSTPRGVEFNKPEIGRIFDFFIEICNSEVGDITVFIEEGEGGNE